MQDQTVQKIREFNRFYLSVMELYENHYLESEYSMTESRVLYEIYECGECSADQIVKKLHLDKGYISRMIKGFENKKILERQRSQTDARFYQIRLTRQGEHTVRELIRRSDQGIQKIIQTFSEKECIQLTEAMDTISRIFAERN